MKAALHIAQYISLLTDYGFKKIFGDEQDKRFLISFLNSVLADREKITNITCLKTERLGKSAEDRFAIYDVYCTNERDERFIVALQRVRQSFFIDRSLFYASFPVQEQAVKGADWDFELRAVYTVCLLDFEFTDARGIPLPKPEKDKKGGKAQVKPKPKQRKAGLLADATSVEGQALLPAKYLHDVVLMDRRDKHVFYEKFNFIYIELPKFKKEQNELSSDLDCWIYVIKNLHRFGQIPMKLDTELFKELFSKANLSAMTLQERMVYEDSLKAYRDYHDFCLISMQNAMYLD